MFLINPNKPQFKANLHCHSTRSDGKLTPEELKQAYKAKGYSVLAITDHESPKDHSSLNEPDFLLLTGYEAYIRTSPDCRYDVFAPEIHLNLFAREAQNETLICYNPACCKYLTEEQQAAVRKAGTQRTREYATDYINEFIRTANENGYLVAYNHPVWSMEDESRIMTYDGIFSMEMVNGNSDSLNGIEYNGPLYDKLLRNGKHWFVHASDDNHNSYPFGHPQNDSFRAFTMISADELSYEAVIDAMEHGNMYSSTGPLIHSLSFENGTVNIECSPASRVICHFGSKHPYSVYAQAGQTFTSAAVELHPQARYLRVTVTDAYGHNADTRAFSREELGLI